MPNILGILPYASNLTTPHVLFSPVSYDRQTGGDDEHGSPPAWLPGGTKTWKVGNLSAATTFNPEYNLDHMVACTARAPL